MTSPTNFREVNVDVGNVITIGAGQDTSTILETGGTSLVGFIVPANWTPADVTFQISPLQNENDIFYNWIDYESGNPIVAMVPETNTATRLLPVDFAGVKNLRFVTSVNQVTEVDIICLMRPV